MTVVTMNQLGQELDVSRRTVQRLESSGILDDIGIFLHREGGGRGKERSFVWPEDVEEIIVTNRGMVIKYTDNTVKFISRVRRR